MVGGVSKASEGHSQHRPEGKLNSLQFVKIGNNWLTITYFSVHCVPSFGTAPPTWWSRPAMTTWTVWWNHQRPPERSFSTKNQGKLSILQFVNIGNNWFTLTSFRVHCVPSLVIALPTWWSRPALFMSTVWWAKQRHQFQAQIQGNPKIQCDAKCDEFCHQEFTFK